MGQGLDKKASPVEHGGNTRAGYPEAYKHEADAIPVKVQLQGDGPNLVRIHDTTCLTCLDDAPGFGWLGSDQGGS